MKKDVYKYICEKEGELITEDGVAHAQIVDAELDPVTCYFDSEGNVKLHTSDLSYVELSLRNLEQLKRLAAEAQAYFDEYYEEE